MKAKIFLLLPAVAMLSTIAPISYADTVVTASFVNGKMFVQCVGGAVTGLAYPGLGVNKGYACNWAFSSDNAHKVNDVCIAAALSDTGRKLDTKPPVAVGASGGGVLDDCEVTTYGIVGPTMVKGEPAGPWCQHFRGLGGAGAIRIGPQSMPTKLVTFDQVAAEAAGDFIVVTASGLKSAVNQGQSGQSGPVVILLHSRHDDHKLLAGIPKADCAFNRKN